MTAMQLSIARTVALGAVQGACELLPISSSAHVALLPRLLGWPEAALATPRRRTLEVALHTGTAVALPWVVRDVPARLPGPARTTIVVAASLAPPVVAGALLAERIERRGASSRAISVGLVLGAAALMAGDRQHGLRPATDATLADGLALGLAQAVALFPGVSRRGATLAAARARGFTREAASDLSWAAGIPVMGAASARAVVLGARRGRLGDDVPALAAGAATAAATLLLLAPLRPRLDRLPYAVWAAWRGLLAATVGARPRTRG